MQAKVAGASQHLQWCRDQSLKWVGPQSHELHPIRTADSTVGSFSTFQFIQILNVGILNESEADKFIWLASVFIRVLNWNQSLRAIRSIQSRKSRLKPVQFIMKGNNSVVLTGAELKVCWCVGWGGALCQKPNLQHSSFDVMKSVRAHHHSEL